MDRTRSAIAGSHQRLGRLQIGERRAAALPHQIERQHVGPQAQPLAGIARQAWTQIAGAGADEDGVNLARTDIGIGERAFRRRSGKCRRVFHEPGVQRVRREIENVIQFFKREVARGDAVFARQNFF